jgi:hypothetical protein
LLYHGSPFINKPVSFHLRWAQPPECVEEVTNDLVRNLALLKLVVGGHGGLACGSD